MALTFINHLIKTRATNVKSCQKHYFISATLIKTNPPANGEVSRSKWLKDVCRTDSHESRRTDTAENITFLLSLDFIWIGNDSWNVPVNYLVANIKQHSITDFRLKRQERSRGNFFWKSFKIRRRLETDKQYPIKPATSEYNIAISLQRF